MPLLLALFAACGPPTDPESLALAACQAMPGLSVPGAGRAMARDAVTPEELALWDEPDYAVGIRTIGLDGYGVIRANVVCEVEAIEPQADGTTRVRLRREEPDVRGLEPWETRSVYKQERRFRTMTFDIVDTEAGPRARVGVAKARAEAEAAWALAHQGRYDEAVAALDALDAWFPDPMILWEQRAMRERQRQEQQTATLALEVAEDMLWLVNQGEAPLAPGPLVLRCGEQTLDKAHPDLAPGERVALFPGEGVDVSTCALALPDRGG